jgi:hypothetical protein
VTKFTDPPKKKKNQENNFARDFAEPRQFYAAPGKEINAVPATTNWHSTVYSIK